MAAPVESLSTPAQSGFTTWFPTIGEVIDEAAERARIDPDTLGPSVQYSARRSLNAIFTNWQTRGTRLSLVHGNGLRLLNQGDADYDLPADCYDVLEAVLVRGSGTSSVSPSALTRSGSTVTVTVPSGHGLILGQPVIVSGANEAEFNGPFLLTTISATSVAYVAPGSTGAATGTVTVKGITNAVDVPMTPYSRDRYLEIPNKLTQGRPDRYYVDRQEPVMKLAIWQTPNVSTDIIKYNYLRLPYDVRSDMMNTPDVARLWFDALFDELAWRLYQKFGSMLVMDKNGQQVSQFDARFFQILKKNADESYRLAGGADRSRSDTRISVRFGR